MQAMHEWDLPVIEKKRKHEYAPHTDSSVRKIFFRFSSGEFGSVTNKPSCSSEKPLGITVLHDHPSGPDRWAPWLISAVADMTSVLYSPAVLNVS